ncbi:MAG: hypothetical protein BWK80_26830 [Desulfobacteraceae bacterium IS3]|nr:MAG: hypothetical protein BWK80_26830 [Desulfobacteraceae bacterium IS3]
MNNLLIKNAKRDIELIKEKLIYWTAASPDETQAKIAVTMAAWGIENLIKEMETRSYLIDRN